MSVLSLKSYREALAAGDTFWRLEISNWGNRGTGADATSIAYPAAEGTPIDGAQYITIGPDSTADEAIITYQPPSSFNTLFTFPSPGINNQVSMSIGITRPGVMLPGELFVRTSLSTQFTDEYYRDGNPTVQAFGGIEPLFEAPRLQLLMYPFVPTMPAFPKRADMYRTMETNANADVGAETLIGIWPVMGRSCKALYFRATGTLVTAIRVGAVVDYVTTQVGLPVARPAEDTVQTANISAVSGVQESIITGRPMQWIAAYYTRTSGAGFINTQLIAQDC